MVQGVTWPHRLDWCADRGEEIPLDHVFCWGTWRTGRWLGTASTASPRATDVIYLQFCKAFDRCPPAPFSLTGEMWIWWVGCYLNKILFGWWHPEGNGSESWWASVTSDVLQFSIFGPVLCNIVTNYIDEGIKCILSKLADNSGLNGAVSKAVYRWCYQTRGTLG